MLCDHSDKATSVWGPRDDGTLAMEDLHRDMQIGEGSGELEVGHNSIWANTKDLPKQRRKLCQETCLDQKEEPTHKTQITKDKLNIN